VQSQVLGEARCRAGLENHGLEEAETHHQVQGDGGLQEVPIQPQVPEPRHAVQVGGGEVLDGHQRGGADLRPIDFCREERKSGMRVRGRGRERGMLEIPLPACLLNPKMGMLCYRRGASPASPRRRRSPSEKKILLLLGNEVGHIQPKRGEGCNVI